MFRTNSKERPIRNGLSPLKTAVCVLFINEYKIIPIMLTA